MKILYVVDVGIEMFIDCENKKITVFLLLEYVL